MTSVARDNGTVTGRGMDSVDSDHITVIIVGITVTLIVVVAVVVFLLVVFLRMRRSVETVSNLHQHDITPVNTIDQQVLGPSGPTWTLDLTQSSYQSSPQHGAISYQEGYQNLISAHLEGGRQFTPTASEPTEPIYMNSTKVSRKYIADNTPQYDYLRQASSQDQSIYDRPANNSAIAPYGPWSHPAVSDYDNPGHRSPPVQLGQAYSRYDPAGETSPYDYPPNNAAVPSETDYDYPRHGHHSAPEAAYDYPRSNRAGETDYDYPRNGATAAAGGVGGRHAPLGNRPSNNGQPIYENFSKEEESAYDRPPTTSRKVSVKGKMAQKNALPRFKSPFVR